ncbi:hypothetical protein TWF694_000363 [Orbilia ellipsospora]|uniref:Uncharacterized protein n=1 Tax=Orbilia ellipsospora TaxID=2528407 RepID=A0AAV9XQ47_9PEZI
MACQLFWDISFAASAGDIFYYNSDNSCLGVPSYVNGSNCGTWPPASVAPSATFLWNPPAGSPVSATCLPPLYTPENYGTTIYSTLPCEVPNSVFTTTGVATYQYATDSTGGMSSIIWTIGPPPASNATISTSMTSVIPSYVLATSTMTLTNTFYSTISGSSTATTTLTTTVTTITSTFTSTTGVVTVPAKRGLSPLEQRQNCMAEGAVGSYPRNLNPSGLTRTITLYQGTSTFVTTLNPLAYAASTGAVTSWMNSTETVIVSATANATVETDVASTVTTTSSSSSSFSSTTITTSSSSTTTTSATTYGPYYITVSAAGTTYSTTLPKRAAATAAPAVEKRQLITEGYVGLADSDGTVGIVTDTTDALEFWVINGELLAMVGGSDLYTYTELSIIADPGYETWVLQDSPPASDSIATEWTGLDLDAISWQNDAFGALGLAQMCAGDPLDTQSDTPVINFWYDTSLDPPGGSCVLIDSNVIAVGPQPSSTTVVTEMVTVTSVSTITGAPSTTYVCNNGGVCPQSCEYDTNLLTTSVCSTASDGLSTCQACLMSTPAPVIATDLAWVTSTVQGPCASPPCPASVVTQWNNAGTPCNDNTVTVWGNNNAGGGGGGVATAATDVATAAANTYVASDSSNNSSTATSKTSTRTGTPTASPSVGLAGKVEVRSGSAMALVFVAGALAIFA